MSKNDKIIKKEQYEVSGGELKVGCPVCHYDGVVDPDCRICDGNYVLPVKTFEELDEYLAKRRGL